ncbi:MAG TPA: hypothetical protein VNB22_02115 [Pyrinomonadaceae bacterium]|nr:hypothetical protein [Pyrinomonadaceae bacterium]
MSKKYFRQCFVNFLSLFVLCLLLITSTNAQRELEVDEFGNNPYYKYKQAKALPCGQRDEAVKIGKELVEKYGNDDSNKSVIDFVRQDIPKIEEADRICRRNNRYDNAYKNKNWNDFFLVSKEIVAEEGDKPIALDVILTLDSVGFDRASVDKDDTFNSDTLYYSNLAIQRIEGEQKSMTGKWGVFVPFNTRDNALGWMNYIIGWLSYNKTNQKKEALEYFYKAVQYKGDNFKDLASYLLIGSLYSDELYRFSDENDKRNDEFEKKLTLMKANADRALIAYAKAYDMEKDARKYSLYRRLETLYKFRFNLRADEKPAGLNQFIPQLIIQPLPKPTDPFEPIFEDTTEIRIHQNKGQ